MIKKNDWRLTGHEEFLNDLKLQKIKFPMFWQIAYKEKNSFYKKLLEDAENFVKASNSGQEYLEDEKVQKFWHEHCIFCWEKFTADMNAECFCSTDYRYWICKSCYEDFKDKFNFTIIN